MMHRVKVGPLEVTYDDVVQAAYVYLPGNTRATGSVKSVDSTNAGHGVLLDLDADGKLIGVEILLPVSK